MAQVLVPMAAVVLAALTAVGLRGVKQQPNVSASERLAVAILQLGGDTEQIYQHEEERLIGICKVHGFDGCFSKNFKPNRQRVAVLHSQPDANSPVVAYIYRTLKIAHSRMEGRDYEELGFGLDVALASAPDRVIPWFENVGDWGYGIHVSGPRVRGEWVQLTDPPLPPNTWLATNVAPLTVIVTPLMGEVVHLTPLQATWPNGTRRTTAKGQYLITGTTNGTVEFREEVEADMACGTDIKAPQVMPPTLRTPASELFSQDGTARFAIVYTRGC